MQKSFEQLEQNGLIYSIRGSGWFVGDNIDLAKEQISTLALKKTKSYFEAMAQIGFDTEMVKNYIKKWEK